MGVNMAYCAYTDIQNTTGTTLSQTIIEAVIAQADREIDGLLSKAGLSGGGTGLIKAASIEFSIAGIITRHRMDGTMPSSITLGGLSMSDNLDALISLHRANGMRFVQDYIDSNMTDSDEYYIAVSNG